MFGQSVSEEQLKALFDASLDAVIGMEADGRTIAWNAQAARTFGWSADEALGAVLGDLIIPEKYRAAHADGLRHYLATGEAVVLNERIEISAIDRSGREFPVELTVIPLKLGDREVFFAFVRDIESRKILEARNKRRADELAILYDASLLVSQGGSFDELVKSCLASICSTTGWQFGHAYLVDEARASVVPSNVWYPSNPALAEQLGTYAFDKGQGLPGRIWQSGEPEYITDIEQTPHFARSDVMRSLEIRSAFGFPVFLDGRVNAVMEFFSIQQRVPDEDQISLVRVLGFQLGRVLERQRAAERQQLLLRELAHRANNMMAIVASVFRQSAQLEESVEELAEKFSSRLDSLGVATRLLSERDWQSTDLKSLIEGSVEPFAEKRSFEAVGPQVEVDGHQVMMLSLIFHELATNAAEYGALRDRYGRLEITWNILTLDSGKRALEFHWSETNGPAVCEPTEKGFGSALLENLIAREPLGEVETAYERTGLKVRFRVSLID